ncbi:M-phase-specific PLK1-interacting protein [Parambassis ranga]|uniref:M-phase-specific PLK1-interacting protein n=1 Tax=Parambassis ranga TaxID=210632 RepID=A0A6P7K229_9TELE|nr:M-phase-specific PLK1-interacting protein [Parambassis ranga]
MYRPPPRHQRSPGSPSQTGRFPSPGSGWGFHGDRSPYRGSAHRGSSPWGCPPCSPRSPAFSPGSKRGYRDGSPAEFSSGSRGSAGYMQRGNSGFRRPHFSPRSASSFQPRPSDASVEKFFSPSMMEDPWKTLQPKTAAEAAARRWSPQQSSQ